MPERGFSSAYRVSPALIWEAGGARGQEGEEKDGLETGMAPTLMGRLTGAQREGNCRAFPLSGTLGPKA